MSTPNSFEPVRAAARWLVRNAAVRPSAARRAAEDFRDGWAASVISEIRWAFAPPRAWLVGVAINLVLSLTWLLIVPLRSDGHRDWVILVGTYFASFILADVTTTNVLGVDQLRVQKALDEGTSLWRIILVKNLALLTIVGLPTLTLAVILTLATETPARLGSTIPEVAVPLWSWLGVGNLVSALLAVSYQPLIRRWRQRRDIRRIMLWLTHLALPYAIFYAADPFWGLPGAWFWGYVPAVLASQLGLDGGRSVIHVGVALAVWMLGIAAAQARYSIGGLRWH